jgi:hypothetical protein
MESEEPTNEMLEAIAEEKARLSREANEARARRNREEAKKRQAEEQARREQGEQDPFAIDDISPLERQEPKDE